MYQKKDVSWIKHGDFELIDIFCMELSFFISYIIRHYDLGTEKIYIYLRMGIILFLIDCIVIIFGNNYKDILVRNKWQELYAVFQHVTIVQLLFLLYEYVTKEAEILSRSVFVSTWVSSVVCCFFARCVWKKVIRKKLGIEKYQRKMMVISSKNNIAKCLANIHQKEYREFKVNSIVFLHEVPQNGQHNDNICTLYGENEMLEYIRQEVVDEVLIDVWKNKDELSELTEMFLKMGVTVHIGMRAFPEKLPNYTVEKIGTSYVITSSVKMAEGWELAGKRLLDIIGAIVGLVIMAIAYVFIAPIIKKESPGPVFFKQERVGRNGRIFNIYKFRSMYLDAEERKKDLMKYNEMQGLMFKMDNDPRIIGSGKGPGKGIGNFIRRTSIDELPQFWNILKGEMSLVGTRPPTVNEYKQYDLHHKIRLSAKPGLTGLWQVSGRSDITDFEEIVKLDTEYIENWSLGLDIILILKTIKVVFSRKGSK